MTPAETRIRVLIADDHPVVREGLALIVSREPDMAVVAQARDGREAITLFLRERPDVTLIDMGLPDMTGVDVIIAARREAPDSRFIVLTIYGGEEDILRALQAGARAYLLKDARAEDLLAAIRAVYAGNRYLPPAVATTLAGRVAEDELTPRELTVLQLLVAGSSNRQIAGRLSIGEATVKTHVNAILRKLEVRSRSQAILVALRRGIVHEG